MDYKDAVVVSLAFLSGLAGASLGGPVGLLAGIVVGAGLGATWAYRTDLRKHAVYEALDNPNE